MSSSPQPLGWRVFASDNYSGICPEAMAALQQANRGHTLGYGDDPWCQRASDLVRELFETDCEIFFTFNGTAANALSLAHVCQSYHSVLCHSGAHVEIDECGAPEFFSNGSKLLLVPGEHGKINPEALEALITRRDDIHFPKPGVVSVTQTTESGTVYSVEELRVICEIVQRHNLRFHMDGARFSNAVAALGVAPKEISWRAGIEVLSFGFTKNGAPVGEVVVFFKKELAREFEFRCKQAGQLASKMRFLAAPVVGLIESGAWLRNAQHGNEIAAQLEKKFCAIPGIKIVHPRQANAVFVEMPQDWAESLRSSGWRFYGTHETAYRFMASWDNTPSDIDALISDLKNLTT